MNPAPEIFKGHLLKWDHDGGPSLPQPKCTHLILNAFSSWPKARLLILMGRTTEYGRNKYSGDKWIVFLTKQSTASSELSREVVSVWKARVGSLNSFPGVLISPSLGCKGYNVEQRGPWLKADRIPPPQARSCGDRAVLEPQNVFSPNQTVHF